MVSRLARVQLAWRHISGTRAEGLPRQSQRGNNEGWSCHGRGKELWTEVGVAQQVNLSQTFWEWRELKEKETCRNDFSLCIVLRSPVCCAWTNDAWLHGKHILLACRGHLVRNSCCLYENMWFGKSPGKDCLLRKSWKKADGPSFIFVVNDFLSI